MSSQLHCQGRRLHLFQPSHQTSINDTQIELDKWALKLLLNHKPSSEWRKEWTRKKRMNAWMDEWECINEWVWMDENEWEWMNEWKNEWEWMNEWMNENEWMRMNEWTDRQMDGQTGRTNKWMSINGWSHEEIFSMILMRSSTCKQRVQLLNCYFMIIIVFLFV